MFRNFLFFHILFCTFSLISVISVLTLLTFLIFLTFLAVLTIFLLTPFAFVLLFDQRVRRTITILIMAMMFLFLIFLFLIFACRSTMFIRPNHFCESFCRLIAFALTNSWMCRLYRKRTASLTFLKLLVPPIWNFARFKLSRVRNSISKVSLEISCIWKTSYVIAFSACEISKLLSTCSFTMTAVAHWVWPGLNSLWIHFITAFSAVIFQFKTGWFLVAMFTLVYLYWFFLVIYSCWNFN